MTIVTMFFDLTAFPDKTVQTRPPTFYLHHGAPVVGLDAPMIVFCDDVTEPLVRSMRTHPLTTYVNKPLAEYDHFKYRDLIESNRVKSRGYKTVDRNTVTYYLMGMFKPVALQIAARLNPYQSSHFAWVDFGCNHFIRGVSTATELFRNPKPKVGALYIHYRSHAELEDVRGFMEFGAPCGIASTVYTVEGSYADKYAAAMFSVFFDLLLKGYGHTDETCMAYCFDRYPELFTLYHGDYYSVITNYNGVKEDIDAIKHYFIDQATNKGRSDLAEAALLQLDRFRS